MIVQTKQGSVRGKECESAVSGVKFFSFLGLPYAEPPIGELRFLPPVPSKKWLGVYDATFDRNICIQGETIASSRVIGSEDCLYLNIHTRETKPSKLKPVMFYIHGGGCLQGSGMSTYRGADYLIEYDVILVTINYRLSALGFLNLRIPECPGNAALKDQLLALKWVKENIKEFGGDPDNITLFGSSAGAACVNFLMVSPLTKGLFRKAIVQSGSALSVWAITHRPKEIAFRLGRQLGFKGDDARGLVEHLRTIPAADIILAALRVFHKFTSEYPMCCFVPVFVPSVEEASENALLPDYPEKLWGNAEPKLCMFGYNGVEASILWPVIPEPIREDAMNMFPYVIKNNFALCESDLADLSEKIKSYYNGTADDQNKNQWQKMINLISDIFVYRFHESFEYLESSKYPPYVYHFTYYNEEVASKIKGIRQRLTGAFHGEEEEFLFVQKFPPVLLKKKGDDEKVRKSMCAFWTNFAKYGNPTEGMRDVEWKPSTVDAAYHLRIDNDLQLMEGKSDEERLAFLKNVLSNANIIEL